MNELLIPTFYESSKGFDYYLKMGVTIYWYNSEANQWERTTHTTGDIAYWLKKGIIVGEVKNPVPSVQLPYSAAQTDTRDPQLPAVNIKNAGLPFGWNRSEHGDFYNSHWQVGAVINRDMRSGQWKVRIHTKPKPLERETNGPEEAFEFWQAWAAAHFPFYPQ